MVGDVESEPATRGIRSIQTKCAVLLYETGKWSVMQDLNLRPVGSGVPKPSALFCFMKLRNGR